MALTRHLIGLLALLACAIAIAPAPAGATGLGQNGRIAFSSGGALYTINADGTGLNHLVETPLFAGNLREPAFSGDGSQIAFTSDAAGSDDIWVVDADFATTPKRLTFTLGGEYSPAFQPFGQGKIAYVLDAGLPPGDIWWMNPDGSAQQPLVATAGDERDPSWSQSGTDLVFVRSTNPGGPGDLVKISPRGGAEELVTSGPADDGEPSWYMGKIAFTRGSDRGPGTDLYQVKPDGNDLVQLTTTPSSELSPAGSPNGKQLVFVAGQQLLLADSDATGAEAIPNVPAAATDPDWEPIFGIIKPQPQHAENVVLEPHGTFAIVSFDLQYKTPLPVVVLEDEDGQEKTGLSAKVGPHHDVIVNGLDPDTDYDVKIVMNKPGGGDPTEQDAGTLTTLDRNVTVWFENVEMHDDSDPGSCGDFLFFFELSAAQKSKFAALANDEITICDGATWDPDDIEVPLTDIEGDTVTGYVLGVDDDADCIFPTACADYTSLDDFDAFKELGEWADQSFVEDVSPQGYTDEGTADESWTKFNTVWVAGGDGDPSFTWHYQLTVSYS